MISLNNLGLTISGKVIFEGISFTALPSAIIHVTGKNGSGKTSLLKMIAQIQRQSKGSITHSKDAHDISSLQKPYCTYIGHNLAIKQEFSVMENMLFWARLYNAEMLIMAAVKYFSLENLLEKKCYELSAGNQKKVALSRLILCPAKLWLLDEIDVNLDENNKKLLTNLMVTHADNGGIIFSASHNKPQVKKVVKLNLEEWSG